MVDVATDDMAVVTRRPFGPAVALWASFPGVHIAQFRFQVIRNCGVISP
jgi:hypothetical protein